MSRVRSLSVNAAVFFECAVVAAGAALAMAPMARSDEIAYLVNVTVRPGYNFANADDALAYGQGICRQVGAGADYNTLVARIESDFVGSDNAQASYLVGQAVNELCPAMIWQLRNAAANQMQPR